MATPIRGLLFAEQDVPPHLVPLNFLVCGAIGSGKTILVQRLLWSLLANGDSVLSPYNRLLLSDPKTEFVSLLYALDQGERLRLLHPYDERSYAWDMAKDIDTPLRAWEAATIFAGEPENNTDQDGFWRKAFCNIIYVVFLAFIRCTPRAGTWTFRDIILTLLYPPYLRYILSLTHTREGEPFIYGARARAAFLEGDPRLVSNLMATLNARLGEYETLAAVWEQARLEGRTLSLSEWVESDLILVLGADDEAKTSVDAANRLIVKRASQLLLARQDASAEDRRRLHGATFIILDEAGETRFEGLNAIARKGRSRLVCLGILFQSEPAMSRIYGREVAEEILGQCGNQAFLRLSDPKTAEWAASQFGTHLEETENQDVQYDMRGGMSRGQGRRPEPRQWLYSGDFLFLPPAGPRHGIPGFVKYAHHPPDLDFAMHLDWQKDVVPYLTSPSSRPGEENFRPRPAWQQYLQPWNLSDWKRLGFIDLPPHEPPHFLGDDPPPAPLPPSSPTTSPTNDLRDAGGRRRTRA